MKRKDREKMATNHICGILHRDGVLLDQKAYDFADGGGVTAYTVVHRGTIYALFEKDGEWMFYMKIKRLD